MWEHVEVTPAARLLFSAVLGVSWYVWLAVLYGEKLAVRIYVFKSLTQLNRQ